MNKQQLPEGWHMVKFGEIATHISKRVEPSETDLDIYVGLEHLDPESLRIKRHGAPSDVEGQKLLVKKGQIIFGKRRAYQRKLGVADWDCICSAHAMVLEANPETVLPEFLPFFMQSDVFMNRAVAISEGSLSPTIKWKTLSEQYFPVPALDRQKGILELLVSSELVIIKTQDALFSAINASKVVIQKILLDNEIGYKTEKFLFKDICDFFGRGSSPTYSDKQTSMVAINQRCVRNGLVSIEEAKYHDVSKNIKDNSFLKDFDICINSTGTGTLGRAALWTNPDGRDYFIDTHITKLTLKKDVVTPELFLEYLNTPYFQRALYSECVSGSTNQIELNKSQQGNMAVKLPSISDQLSIYKTINRAVYARDELAQQESKAILIKHSILNRYWSH